MKAFDEWCENVSTTTEKQLCDAVLDDFARCFNGFECISTQVDYFEGTKINPPDSETCYTYEAYNYLSGDDCETAWRNWDRHCGANIVSVETKETCTKIDEDFNKSQQLLLAKAKGGESHNSFAYDFSMGAVASALSVAVGIFAIKKCSNKHATIDHFQRV